MAAHSTAGRQHPAPFSNGGGPVRIIPAHWWRHNIFFERNLIVFIHLPKCGGTSLDRSLKEMFGDYWFREDANHDPRSLSREQRARVKVLTGHFGLVNPFIEVMERDPFYISTVREPVSRALSMYAYMSQKHQDSTTNRLYQAPVEEGLSNLLDINHAPLRNDMCHRLSGERSFNAAKKAIQENGMTVVTISSFSRIIEIIAPLAPHPQPSSTLHLKNTNSSKLKISAGLRQRLIGKNAEDARLFDWVAINENALLEEAAMRFRDGHLRSQ